MSATSRIAFRVSEPTNARSATQDFSRATPPVSPATRPIAQTAPLRPPAQAASPDSRSAMVPVWPAVSLTAQPATTQPLSVPPA